MNLLFTPVRQDPQILSLFLKALRGVREIDGYLFIDDNDDPASSQLLQYFKGDFEDRNGIVTIIPGQQFSSAGSYPREGALTHEWNVPLTNRITQIRNFGLRFAVNEGYFNLFSVDSDVILPPNILETLLDSSQAILKPIISEVYWTQWHRSYPYMPQVWDKHPYLFDEPSRITRLATPGTYPVAGLGGCTLITLYGEHLYYRLSYDPIPGCDFLGEDRHFCTRASVLEYTLWADTNCPPFHVYYPSQLEEAREWFEGGCDPTYFRRNWVNETWQQHIERS